MLFLTNFRQKARLNSRYPTSCVLWRGPTWFLLTSPWSDSKGKVRRSFFGSFFVASNENKNSFCKNDLGFLNFKNYFCENKNKKARSKNTVRFFIFDFGFEENIF
nr:ORF-2 [Cloning vector pVEcLa4]